MKPMHPAKNIHLRQGDLLNEGRYKIEKELNRGGTAVVYAAEDLHTRNYVALKVMNGPDQVPIKVVRREITFSSSMNHDNIVRLLDVFAEKQQMVIVWELINGPDLLDLLNENSGCLPEAMAAFYFVQLLEAVTFMHAQGYCHRDIKPENCMVQRSNRQLKLIDFGLSKHLNSAHTLGVGTPDYMCPEMLPRASHSTSAASMQPSSMSLTQLPSYDAKAVDAWAMGVLMFLLTTGKYPFEDPRYPNNLAQTIGNVLAGRVRPFPPTMSQGCRALITGLLQVDVGRRTTLEELKASSWLQAQSLQYACTIGRPELVDFSRYSVVQAGMGDGVQQRGAVQSGAAGTAEIRQDGSTAAGMNGASAAQQRQGAGTGGSGKATDAVPGARNGFGAAVQSNGQQHFGNNGKARPGAGSRSTGEGPQQAQRSVHAEQRPSSGAAAAAAAAQVGARSGSAEPAGQYRHVEAVVPTATLHHPNVKGVAPSAFEQPSPALLTPVALAAPILEANMTSSAVTAAGLVPQHLRGSGASALQRMCSYLKRKLG